MEGLGLERHWGSLGTELLESLLCDWRLVVYRDKEGVVLFGSQRYSSQWYPARHPPLEMSSKPLWAPSESRRMLHECLLSSRFAGTNPKDTRLQKDKWKNVPCHNYTRRTSSDVWHRSGQFGLGERERVEGSTSIRGVVRSYINI
jgi:hypothetical protein